MVKQRVVFVLAMIASVLLFTSVAGAQSTFGTIRGRVVDPRDLAIPNAQVTVTETSTNIAKTTRSGESGGYEVVNLLPGTYTVAVDATGFKRYLADNVVLNAHTTVVIDAKLELGTVTSKVTVTAGAPVISPGSAQFGDVKTGQQYETTPENNRGDWDSFIYPYLTQVPGLQTVGGHYWVFSFAGTPPAAEEFTVDGITMRDKLYGTLAGPAAPTMDSVKEIDTNFEGNPAEYASAGQVTIVTRGGTNQFHGDAFEYYHTAGMGARNFFATTLPFNVENDFGGGIGGPIIKNKMFFHADVEAWDLHQSTLFNLNVPSLAQRQGTFSSPITDPFTGQPYAGNHITNLNATAVALQNAWYPLPNYGPPDSVVGNYRAAPRSFRTKQLWDVRVDYQFSNSNSFYARWNQMRSPNTWFVDMPAMGYSNQLRQDMNGVLSDTETFRPNLLNEARLGFSRNYNPYSGRLYGPDMVQKFGLTGLPAYLPPVMALPTFNISGYQGIYSTDDRTAAMNNEVVQDNLTWLRGRHTFKFGIDVIHQYAAKYPVSLNQTYGSQNYTGAFTGNAYADFLLGLPYTASDNTWGFFRDHWTNNYWGFFAQDSFKVNSRLTLDYGLRYEIMPPYNEHDGRMASFDPATGKLVVSNSNGLSQLSPAFVASNLLPIETASQAGLPSGLVYTWKKAFGPRIGLAYRLTSNSDIRAAYGIFYENEPASLWENISSGPFTGSATSPPNTITNGVPTFQLPTMFPPTLLSSSVGLAGLNPHWRPPMIQHWNVTLEREFHKIGFHATYIGTTSTQLPWIQDLNQVQPSTVPFSTSRRPYPTFSSLLYYANGATSSYNGLILSADRKLSHGLLFQAGYTWAKELTDELSAGDSGYQPQNSFNLRADRGNDPDIRRQRFTYTLMYQLAPSGANAPWFSHVAKGWIFSLTGLAQTGPYFTPTFCGSDPANVGTNCGRPDRIGNGNLSNPTIDNWFNVGAFAVPSATAGRFGNSGTGILEGPGTFDTDFGIYKPVRITERLTGRLEVTATNIFNHPNFNSSGAVITSASGPVVQSTQNIESAGARTVQIGLRLQF